MASKVRSNMSSSPSGSRPSIHGPITPRPAEGRALPPGPQEVLGGPRGHRDQVAASAGHRPFRRLLQRRPAAPGIARRTTRTVFDAREKARSERLARQERRVTTPSRQGRRCGLGDPSPQGPPAPHRRWPSLCGLAGRHAHPRPQHRGRRARWISAATPRPGSDQGLSAHGLSERPALR